MGCATSSPTDSPAASVRSNSQQRHSWSLGGGGGENEHKKFETKLVFSLRAIKQRLDNEANGKTFSFTKIILKFGTIHKVLRRIRVVFQSFDHDNDGSISKDGFRLAMEHLHCKLSEADVQNLFEVCDMTHSDTLGLREFYVMLAVARALDAIPEIASSRLSLIAAKSGDVASAEATAAVAAVAAVAAARSYPIGKDAEARDVSAAALLGPRQVVLEHGETATQLALPPASTAPAAQPATLGASMRGGGGVNAMPPISEDEVRMPGAAGSPAVAGLRATALPAANGDGGSEHSSAAGGISAAGDSAAAAVGSDSSVSGTTGSGGGGGCARFDVGSTDGTGGSVGSGGGTGVIGGGGGGSLPRNLSFSKFKWARIPSMQRLTSAERVEVAVAFPESTEEELRMRQYGNEVLYVMDLIIAAYFQFDPTVRGFIDRRRLLSTLTGSEGEGSTHAGSAFADVTRWGEMAWDSEGRLSFEEFVYTFSHWLDIEDDEEDDIIDLSSQAPLPSTALHMAA